MGGTCGWVRVRDMGNRSDQRVRVRRVGHLPWNDRRPFVTAVLDASYSGLQWQRDAHWRVFFRTLPIPRPGAPH